MSIEEIGRQNVDIDNVDVGLRREPPPSQFTFSERLANNKNANLAQILQIEAGFTGFTR